MNLFRLTMIVVLAAMPVAAAHAAVPVVELPEPGALGLAAAGLAAIAWTRRRRNK